MRAPNCFVCAARAGHVAQIIRPALESGQWVLSDRFADSSEAYQGALGLDADFIRAMNDFATGELAPKRTFFLDISPETSINRRGQTANDRIEARGPAFLGEVRARYRELARREGHRITVLNGELSPDELEERIWEETETFLVS